MENYSEKNELLNYLQISVVAGFEGAIGGIPIVGNICTKIHDACRHKYEQDRLYDSINRISNAIKELDEDKINKEFLESEPFADLMVKLLESIKTQRYEKKRKYLESILIDTISEEKFQFNAVKNVDQNEFRETIVGIISNLNMGEMEIIAKLAENKVDRVFPRNSGFIKNITLYSTCSIDSLIGKGLIYDATSKYLSEQVGNNVYNPDLDSIQPCSHIVISKLGRNLINYILYLKEKFNISEI